MKHLEFKVMISAPANKVWETMLHKDTYEQWVGRSWPNSTYEGSWAQGEKIRFVGPDGSGTLAEIVKAKPHESILARHIAALGPGGTEDRTSDLANGWIGTTEGYAFTEEQGKTTVTVSIETTPEWSKMFEEGWPGALQELKKITERQFAAV
ncbi:MAG: SRPBCC domain-containing protein [Bacteroidota bacterium]|nr:SRPBCC domain-containing protein [Bacteroidota bacterium]